MHSPTAHSLIFNEHPRRITFVFSTIYFFCISQQLRFWPWHCRWRWRGKGWVFRRRTRFEDSKGLVLIDLSRIRYVRRFFWVLDWSNRPNFWSRWKQSSDLEDGLAGWYRRGSTGPFWLGWCRLLSGPPTSESQTPQYSDIRPHSHFPSDHCVYASSSRWNLWSWRPSPRRREAWR